jgi:transaldolase
MNTATNPLLRLKALGQSVGLDYIRRGLIESGELARLIAEDGVCGLTANPATFEKAIAGHHDYDCALTPLLREAPDAAAVYEALAVEDIRAAADLLGNEHGATAARNGHVSLEVSPHLAHDTAATVIGARRLWARVERPNLMIKVPATRAGLPAIRQLFPPETVNTLPPETLAAYRAKGEPAVRIGQDLDQARGLPARLAAPGIELEEVADRLEREGVRKFVEPFDRLLALLEERRCEAVGGPGEGGGR